MKNFEQIIYGMTLAIVIFLLSNIIGRVIDLNIDFLGNAFYTYSTMLLLSVLTLFILKKHVDYKISLPNLKKLLKPIVFGFCASFIVNVSISLIIIISGNKIEGMEIITKMTPFEVIIFIFIYASVVEEILFRGFLLNILKPMNAYGIMLFVRKICFPVIISAIMFGSSHLILITTGAGFLLLLKTIIFTTIIGLVAGYYQEKYNNNAYAIAVHMSGNLLVVFGSIYFYYHIV